MRRGGLHLIIGACLAIVVVVGVIVVGHSVLEMLLKMM